MNIDITNQNLYLLLPSKAMQVARIYQEQHGGSALDALRLFYRSEVYKQLAP